MTVSVCKRLVGCKSLLSTVFNLCFTVFWTYGTNFHTSEIKIESSYATQKILKRNNYTHFDIHLNKKPASINTKIKNWKEFVLQSYNEGENNKRITQITYFQAIW